MKLKSETRRSKSYLIQKTEDGSPINEMPVSNKPADAKSLPILKVE